MNINTKIPKLRRFVLQNFPFIEADFDALTDYQLICKVVEYLNSVIQQVNNLTDATVGLIDAFNELKSYVEHYFDTLDLQEEVNKKLEDMVEDGTFDEILIRLFNLYPVIEGETGVTNTFYEYGDVLRYGAKCDGTTDDKTALNNAISCAVLMNKPVKVHGKMYVSETINTHGVTIEGDEQPYASGAYYPNGIGYDYPKNLNDGFNITFAEYIETIPDGTCIISDIANPILTTDYNKGFKLKNFGVYGWLRNNHQIGLSVPTDNEATYYPGHHEFNNFSVFNTGSHGILLRSLETTELNNLRVELVNGYGLYILGDGVKDCPVDYSTLNYCRFRYTRLDAIYIENAYRKNLTIRNTDFNYIGQYDFGTCNDQYGNRVLPEDANDVAYSIHINGYDPIYGHNVANALTLINNYGEHTNGFFKLENISSVNEITSRDNRFVKLANTSVNCFMNIKARYIENAEFGHTASNYNTNYIWAENLTQLRCPNGIVKQVSDSLGDYNFFANTNRNTTKAIDTVYAKDISANDFLTPIGNFKYFNSSSSESQTVEIDTATILSEYITSNPNIANGCTYASAILALSHTGDASSAPTADLVLLTRHHNKYYVTFLTNNTGASADTTGKITITVPAYRVATLQFLQIPKSILGK